MHRYQAALLALSFFGGCFVTILYQSSTASIEPYVVSADVNKDNFQQSHGLHFVTKNETKTSAVTVTPTKLKEDALEEKFNENVPKHVAIGISKLYKELKANGSIFNDLLTTPNAVIPNIYHYVRFNQSKMRFYEMLSIKSALKIGAAEAVYIHTNQHPEGRFWDMIKNEQRIQVVHRNPPTSIFGKPFGWVQHASDLARIQILREHGGIYLDNDCIVLHEFERIRKHHCVVSKSSHERHMGNMLMMATKDCVFMRMYEELYKLDYQRDRWYYNGGELPQYAILDQYPGVAFMADEGVQQGMMYWLWRLDNSVTEFQKYWNIIHLFYGHKDYTYNDTMEYDEINIKTRHNSFGRIARWIMYDHEEPYDS